MRAHVHPYRDPAPAPSEVAQSEPFDWGLTAPLVVLLLACGARVVGALERREHFGAEPSMALLLLILAMRLLWEDVAAGRRPSTEAASGRQREREG